MASAIHIVDTAASAAQTESTTDVKDAPADADTAANIEDSPAGAALPTTNAEATPPTAPTASCSKVNTSLQPCQVFTIRPDLPLTEDERYNGPILHLFLRYIDDCMGAASCSHEEPEQFIHFTDTFRPNLKFTGTISDSCLSFLDLSVSIS
eukprot:g28279.t1